MIAAKNFESQFDKMLLQKSKSDPPTPKNLSTYSKFINHGYRVVIDHDIPKGRP